MALEHWQLGKTALQCLGILLSDKRWTDISFKCRDQDAEDTGDCICAHKVILASRSPVFEAMFYGPCASETYPLEMKEIDSEIFNLFLTYLYTDQANLTESTAPLVLQTAHMYQVSGLVEYCFKYMIQNITVRTALDVLQMALFYKEKTYEDQVLNFIDENASGILECDSFLTLPKDCLLLVLRGNTFNASEKNIFQSAVKWAETKCDMETLPKDGRTVRTVLKDVFYQLRVPLMTVKEFSESMFLKGYYGLEEYERILSYIVGGGDAGVLPHRIHVRYPIVDKVEIVEKKLSNNTDSKCRIATKLSGSVKNTATILSFAIDAKDIQVIPDCQYCTSSCRNCKGLRSNKQVTFVGRFQVKHNDFELSQEFEKEVDYDCLCEEKFSVSLKSPVTLVKREEQFNILLILEVTGNQRIRYTEWRRGTFSGNFDEGPSKSLILSYPDTSGFESNTYSIKSIVFRNESGRDSHPKSVEDGSTVGPSPSKDDCSASQPNN